MKMIVTEVENEGLEVLMGKRAVSYTHLRAHET